MHSASPDSRSLRRSGTARNLSRRDGLGQAELDVAHAAAARDDVDTIVGLEAQHARVARVHLDPGVRRQPLENRDVGRLGAGVPVLELREVDADRAAVEQETQGRRAEQPQHCAEHGVGALTCGADSGPDECRGLQALPADGQEMRLRPVPRCPW